LAAVELEQRVLVDTSAMDMRTHLFGHHLSMPVILAPVGLAGLAARRGEVQAAKAADAEGVPFTLSTVSVCPIAEVCRGASPPWFQLYMLKDRGFMAELLAQANDAACPVLVFTVDMPMPGRRRRDHRSGLAGAPGAVGAMRRIAQAITRPGWAMGVGLAGGPHHLGNVAPVLAGRTGLDDFMNWMGVNFDPSVGWADLDWVRARWSGPIVVKGVLEPADAEAALASGADGVVVSNHGGRQLDGVKSTAEALPAVVDRLGGAAPILVDGGIRGGLDVLRMISLGADAVMIGRPWVWALACDGEAGVRRMLAILREELAIAMALTGSAYLECARGRRLRLGHVNRPGFAGGSNS
jgi:L-lactate dehydrogenase (cytochrome)